MAQRVIVLDAQARPVGVEEKQAAHTGCGVPHLAFSVVLFGTGNRVLLQQRALGKYHFPGFWSNSCCSHPRPQEGLLKAAVRRVREELGVEIAEPSVRGAFWYQARDENSGLIEREYDVVLTGELSMPPRPNPSEVAAVCWRRREELRGGMPPTLAPVTPWLKRTLEVAFADEPTGVSPYITL